MKAFQQLLFRHRVLNKVLNSEQYANLIASISNEFGKDLAGTFELYFTKVGDNFEFELSTWEQVEKEFSDYFC